MYEVAGSWFWRVTWSTIACLSVAMFSARRTRTSETPGAPVLNQYQ